MDRIGIALLLVALVGVAVAARRARGGRSPGRIDPDDFGLPHSGRAVAGFTAPYCLPCQEWTDELGRVGIEPMFVDVSKRPELARRYRIQAAPWIALVDLPSGRVLRHWRDSPASGDVAAVREAVRPT